MSAPLNRPPLMPDEPLLSHASRTARCHGTDLTMLCHELGLSRRGLANGSDDAVRRYADLTALSPTTLSDRAFRRDGGLWWYEGQALHCQGVRRLVLKVCPCCLRDDVAASGPRPDRAIYVRAHWLVNAVRTCERHLVELVDVVEPDAPTGPAVHDLASRLAPSLVRIDRMSADARRRAPTSLEGYIVGRLRGEADDGGFIERMPLYAATRTCEMLGAAALFGPRTRLRSLDADAWRTAGAVGFDIAALGGEAVRSCLLALMANHGVANRNTGANKVYGFLYKWLGSDESGKGYEQFRDLLRDVIVETIPLPAGADVLGVPLDRRRVHSLRSAAAETGRGLKGLRRELRAAGVLPVVEGRGPGRLVAIPVDKAATAMEDLARSLPRKVAAERVNASITDLRRLARAGIVKPIVPKPETSGSHVRFSIRALDEFVADLHRGVTGTTSPGSDMREVPLAAKSLNRKMTEVVSLVLKGELRHVVQRSGATGFRSILVDRVELSTLAWGEHDASLGMRMAEASKALGLWPATTGALVRGGHLAARSVRTPKGRVVLVFDEDALRGFSSEFATLAEVARRHDVHSATMLALLEGRKIRPALPTEGLYCSFYRRAEVDAVLGRGDHSEQPPDAGPPGDAPSAGTDDGLGGRR